MKLYHTLTQRMETFQPRGEKVSIYVCGITPYDTTHLGHAFTYTSYDVLIRYLELRGLKVGYVQNVTDVDDDILRKSRALGADWQDVVNEWTEHFIYDMVNLNVRPPDEFPRATSVITEIVDAVQGLLDRGVAYEANGNVYFSVDAWPPFGKLSHLPRSEMLPIANERGNFPDDPMKRDPLDFVLWQAQRPGEPAWQSPWGLGRPGWHIECSTLAVKHLGEVIDIHGGGEDLAFPHHECEIAQVEARRADKPFVRYWMHTAMVRHEGEKMSKSLGNLVMVDKLLETYSPDGLRLYLNRHHYRKAWEYSEGDLKKAEKLAGLVREAVMAPSGKAPALSPDPYSASFLVYMEDDLNTPKAVDLIERLAKDILDGSLSGRDVTAAQGVLRTFGKVFGLRMDQDDAEPRVLNGWRGFLRNFQKA